MNMEGTIYVFHYSDILYQSRYLGNKPVGWDTLATSMNPSSAPLVPLPMIVSTFLTSFLPSKSGASRENRFNACDVVSVKMTE